MSLLTHETLLASGYDGFIQPDAPERVLQFGEGNFLRAFVDYFFDVANERLGFNGRIAIVKPRGGAFTDVINAQEGLYTLYLRGTENGKAVQTKRVITSVSRCIDPYRDFDVFMNCAKNPELRYIVSNTTEAGIVYSDEDRLEDTPAKNFPAKLTQFLYERFKVFSGKPNTGFVILSCELIDNNGRELLACVEKYSKHWALPEAFLTWVRQENIFCSTLVDRIVTGYPAGEAERFNAENGYEDKLMVAGELFGFWAIEGPEKLKKLLPFEAAGLPVIVTADQSPYKKRKVRILNGAHTTLAVSAILAGKTLIRECMEDETVSSFTEKLIHKEIIPVIPMLQKELTEFARAVSDRFRNPYIAHRLSDISLNSVAKWRARVMPSLLEYREKFSVLPELLTFSLAALLRFYRCAERDGVFYGEGAGGAYPVRDDRDVCEYFAALPWQDCAQAVETVLAQTHFWGRDLNQVPGLAEKVTGHIEQIDAVGAKAAMAALL